MLRPVFAAVLIALVARIALADTLTPDQPAQPAASERHAVEAAIWGMPAVNYDLMLQEMLSKTEGKVNQVIYWGRPLDWHNQTLTPSPDALYFMAFLDTANVGPIVIEVPPACGGSMNANFANVWQMPLEEAGLLGVDKGAGLKLLILPPGYTDKIPDGYAALRPGTWKSFALFRTDLPSHSDADVAKSITYGKEIEVYPLSQASAPPPTAFTDVQDVLFDSTIRYDESFFVRLNRIVQTEPWLDRDREMIAKVRTLGIEKGKPFAPDVATKETLNDGIREAHAALAARYDAGLTPYFEGTHWSFPAPPELMEVIQAGFADPDTYPIDANGLAYHYAYIGIKRTGSGQLYLINIRDKNGENYDGSKSYRLHVPPGAPTGHWSLTAYDRETHTLIRNVDHASRASNAVDVKKNIDGSMDLYIGPKAPAGEELNWIPTDPSRQFELMFRLYQPKKQFFDNVWTLPDVEPLG